MNFDPNELHYEYNTKGYMLFYKGKAIGGAGIDRHAKGCRSNLTLFRDMAEQDKNAILAGRGQNRYLYEMSKIDEQKTD